MFAKVKTILYILICIWISNMSQNNIKFIYKFLLIKTLQFEKCCTNIYNIQQDNLFFFNCEYFNNPLKGVKATKKFKGKYY